MLNKTKRYFVKSNLHFMNGDIFAISKDRVCSKNTSCSVIIPHVCNNIDLFGAGFAGAVADHYPEVKANFHLLGNQAKLGNVQYIKVFEEPNNKNQLVFANMIAQNDIINSKNPRPLNYEFLVKTMIDIRRYASTLSDNTESIVEIHCPKFGSGLAGGNWNFIEYLIEDIWKNISVFVYIPQKNNK